jgi:hypothetical protein
MMAEVGWWRVAEVLGWMRVGSKDARPALLELGRMAKENLGSLLNTTCNEENQQFSLEREKSTRGERRGQQTEQKVQ